MASPAVGVPSAGAEIEPTVNPPSPSGDTSQLTDDQILDQAHEQGGEDKALDAGADGETAESVKPQAATGGEPKEPEVEEPATETVEPAELKELFKANPQLRTAYYAEKAYREVFPTVAEAREVKTLFPGGLEDAKAAATSREDLERFDNLFYSDNPQDHAEFIRTLHEEDPGAFAHLARAFPDVLAEIDPRAYREDTSQRMEGVLRNLASAHSDDQNLQNAIAVISHKLFGRTSPEQRPSPRDSALQQRERHVEQRERDWNQRQFSDFRERVDKAADTEADKLIRSTLDGLLKESPASDKAKQRMTGEVEEQIRATLKADRGFLAQLRRAVRSGKMDEAHQQQLVAITVQRVRPLVKGAVAKVVQEWTKDVLATNSQRLHSQRTQTERKDITGGGAVAGGKSAHSRMPSRGEVDWAKTDDDTWADAVTSGDYSKVVLRKK